LFERYAVIGLIGGSFFVAQLTWPGDPIMCFGTPFVSGSSAYFAQRYILGKSDHAQSRLVGLTPANLIALGTLSALIKCRRSHPAAHRIGYTRPSRRYLCIHARR
ncbi:MAG: hypothetical protein EBX02_09475, partial [Betaproteobacteria bacterium]|nr:hypothetical protein [Betaproteobacteria bacterium]